MGREMQVMKTIGNIFLFLKTCIMVSDLKKKSLWALKNKATNVAKLKNSGFKKKIFLNINRFVFEA